MERGALRNKAETLVRGESSKRRRANQRRGMVTHGGIYGEPEDLASVKFREGKTRKFSKEHEKKNEKANKDVISSRIDSSKVGNPPRSPEKRR